ncbi:hypothetical protein ACEU2D_21000 [Brevibacillus laterosporus]|uniref:hypothetical protein n=1 Tax=Brevibacillus laterosporus TaxID=1465 RepID=UPI0035A5B384
MVQKKNEDKTKLPTKLKVNLINRVLTEIKEVLKNDPTIEFLDLLDDDTLPQNGDAVLILGQYQAAMKQFRLKYYGWVSRDGEHRWRTQERP